MELPDERGLIICPNPRCRRKIEQPILLSNLSTASVEQYYACPHCFIKLDTIYPQTQKRKEEEKKRGPLLKPLAREEKELSRCAGYLGYLAHLPKNRPVPRECVVCPKVLDCAMGISDS